MAEYSSQFVQVVLDHWKKNFPKEAERLEKQGTLLEWGEYAAERAAQVHSQAIADGAAYSQAEDLSLSEWGQPPTLNDPSLPVPQV